MQCHYCGYTGGPFTFDATTRRYACGNTRECSTRVASNAAMRLSVVDAVTQLHDATEPIPGRPGYRRDADGREWYSAAWLDE